MLVGARRALITSLKLQRACSAVPPKPSQSGRRSSEEERDFGDVAIDAKETSKSYTVEGAEEKVESFGEKTRRTVLEAWDAAKDTTKEIEEGVKRRREEDGDRVAGMWTDDKEKNF